jgi:hypothetical protein
VTKRQRDVAWKRAFRRADFFLLEGASFCRARCLTGSRIFGSIVNQFTPNLTDIAYPAIHDFEREAPMKLRIIAVRVALGSSCLATAVAFSPSALAGYRCTGWDFGKPNRPCIRWQFVSGPEDFTRPKVSTGLKGPTRPSPKLKRVPHSID